MSTPTPRPALRKAADAHIHPAAPGHSTRGLKQAADSAAEQEDGDRAAESVTTQAPEAGHRLSGPIRGNTSDSLRGGAKGGHRRSGQRARKPEKTVDLTVQVPKSVRKDFRAAVKAGKKDPNEVVTALLLAWLDT